MAAVNGISPLLAQLALGNIGAIGSSTDSSGLFAPSGLDFLGSGSTVVELSGLGQLLSAVSGFQSSLAVIQPGSTSSGLGQNFGTDFASLAAEAQSFVDAFNGLQGSLGGLQGFNASFGNTGPGADLSAALNAAAGANFANGNSSLTSLGQIGINLQTSPLGSSNLSIDLGRLQAAFNSDQAGTFGLLTQAINGFSQLTGSFSDQTSSLFATTSALDQVFANQFLGLGLGLTNNLGGSNLFALTSLLAQGSSDQGVTSNNARTILALNQFQLVSSLLSA